ncbi:sensor histidine kinase [Halalkalibacterium halodurans]|uniref:Sensor protein BceS n=1 Tax=Halalkalibacterium halodurans (strain ATCC BAA-125 / DSM 18197 / FERM 7344 / JCM 9153 / C-125) TaxID=272558 RepID=BCES_HALH5|nr:sensor histidine kinase [Halalkalibacterium halodurans]Q9K620.1 RecName: Full=Sensor protein BceS [Halalkalibacterium halodurans C-125]MED4123235.1 sensor histidine kinase [Halalkalibacterium halodurans]MED4172087.1 sensor histidine kinase [Halalkalibacterium halodurans]BAB07631.1 two-component sensor histidine kinase [Halalkalibacterium halodurans C-125]
MIKTFIKERGSWILIIIFLQCFTVFIAYLDSAIPLAPVFYSVFLSSMIFLFFLAVRYKKETTFYRKLEEWDKDLDVTNLAAAESPFERIIEQTIVKQTGYLQEKAHRHETALEQEKDDLLAWIHEIKTPLTAMHLIIDRLEDRTIKGQLTYEWMRIHLLLDQQLHQKRIPFMENDLYVEKVNLESVLHQEIKTLQSWCIQKGIGFDLQLEVTDVLTDAKWLSFILRQLLSNAVKYSEASDIIIKSDVVSGKTVVEVTDFGRGIEPKDLPRIFEKGFTSTKTDQTNGATGMGLYLAKRVAEPLLIDLAVSSTVGEGTTFTLTFPKENEFVRTLGM